jgi:hypothetical protein
MLVHLKALVASFIAAVLLAIPVAGASASPRHHCNRRCQRARLIVRYEPYKGTVGGDGWPVYYGHFAVPACIVTAESHGLLHEHSHPWTSSGEYQITAGSWAAYGGSRFAALPYEANHLDQSIIASRIWDHGRGAGNWTTAAGCGY